MLYIRQCYHELFALEDEIMKKILIPFVVIFLLTACQSGSNLGSSFLFPSPFFPPTQDLRQSVEEALMQNDELAVSRIHVEAEQRKITLSGYVKKIRQSDTAEQIARNVSGVKEVENNIIVKP